MTAAINSGIARLEFDKKFFGGLIWMLFQPLMHLSQVSDAAVRNRCRPARLIAEAAIFAWRDDDAASTRILTPLFHALFEASYMPRMKASWELNAKFIEQLRGGDVRTSLEAAAH